MARNSARKLLFLKTKAFFTCLASPNKCSLHCVLRGLQSSSVQVREKLRAYIFLKYMLSVCDYQWKCAITRVNLILEAKCPTGWHIANFFSFPVILCKSCHFPHLRVVYSHQKH